jgi:hypothetical protein
MGIRSDADESAEVSLDEIERIVIERLFLLRRQRPFRYAQSKLGTRFFADASRRNPTAAAFKRDFI